MTILLIDGDNVLHKACAAAEKSYYAIMLGEEEMHRLPKGTTKKQAEEIVLTESAGVDETYHIERLKEVLPIGLALDVANEMVNNILTRWGHEDYRLFIGGASNNTFRKIKYPDYKNNRLGRPTHYKAVKEYMINEMGAEVIEGVEVDDILGHLQTEDTVICGVDKDLLQIPGVHYNTTKYQITEVTYKEGFKAFAIQLLMGDSADAIKGIPGIGIAKAKKILTGLTEPDILYHKVTDAYLDNGLDLAELQTNCDLMWLQREPNQRFICENLTSYRLGSWDE